MQSIKNVCPTKNYSNWQWFFLFQRKEWEACDTDKDRQAVYNRCRKELGQRWSKYSKKDKELFSEFVSMQANMIDAIRYQWEQLERARAQGFIEEETDSSEPKSTRPKRKRRVETEHNPKRQLFELESTPTIEFGLPMAWEDNINDILHGNKKPWEPAPVGPVSDLYCWETLDI